MGNQSEAMPRPKRVLQASCGGPYDSLFKAAQKKDTVVLFPWDDDWMIPTLVRKSKQLEKFFRSKYMPHQGKQECKRRARVRYHLIPEELSHA